MSIYEVSEVLARRLRHGMPWWLITSTALLACGQAESDDESVDSGCSSQSEDCGDAEWNTVFADLSGALISVAGSSENDVWVVGSDPGSGATILQYDGNRWQKHDLGVEGVDLWWVRVFGPDDVFVGGTGGVIARYQGSSFERLDTPGGSTVFGIWGASSGDVWAVGGDPENQSSGFIWRYNGESWSDLTLGLGQYADAVFYKVWGRANDDLWIVGTGGTAFHYDGETLTPSAAGTERQLLTVHGLAQGKPGFVAVGGFGNAVIVENDTGMWTDVTPSGTVSQLFGVHMSAPGEGYAVGADGTVMRRSSEGWQLEDTGLDTDRSFHSVWIDPKGGVWAAGGDIIAPPLAHGLLAHLGGAISNTIEE